MGTVLTVTGEVGPSPIHDKLDDVGAIQMQCPSCGMNMGDAEECPHCGAKVAAYPARRQYIKREPRYGFSLVVILLVLAALFGGGALVFFKSDTYLTKKAQRHYENREYPEALEILYDIMKRSGPDSERLQLASDALRAQGEERIDQEKYLLALPLFEEIIKINEGAMGAGGSDSSILDAEYDKAICYIKLAQSSGEFVKPYGEYILNAEKSIDRATELASKLPDDETLRIKPDLTLLAAVVAAERASAFWHENNTPQAKIYFNKAEAKFNEAVSSGLPEEELNFLRKEMDKLRKRLY